MSTISRISSPPCGPQIGFLPQGLHYLCLSDDGDDDDDDDDDDDGD